MSFPTLAPRCELLRMIFFICSFDVLCSPRRAEHPLVPSSTRRSRRPPEPAGPTPFPELAVAIDGGERRRGRGAAPNAAAASSRKRGSRSTTAGRASTNCRRSRPVTLENPRNIITRNKSPDICFDRSINPYRGCEHGCIYCFARPTHAYHDLSPGLDFETELFAKPDAARAARAGAVEARLRAAPIAMGTNTDPYQPIEREYADHARHSRSAARLQPSGRHRHQIGPGAARHRHPGADGGKRDLAKVALSVTTLDPKLARTMEPRASTPPSGWRRSRLDGGRHPDRGDDRADDPCDQRPRNGTILDAAAQPASRKPATCCCACRSRCGPVPRMAEANYPDHERHVISLIRDMRGGKDYDSPLGPRMSGTGPYAWMIGRRFELACERLGLNAARTGVLSTQHFQVAEDHRPTTSVYSTHDKPNTGVIIARDFGRIRVLRAASPSMRRLVSSAKLEASGQRGIFPSRRVRLRGLAGG